MKKLLTFLLILIWSGAYAESDITVRTAVNDGFQPGARNIFDLTTAMYITATRGTSGSSQPILIFRSANNGGTWTTYVDTSLIAGSGLTVQATALSDTAYIAPGVDGVTARMAKFYYNGSTTRDTALPRDTISATTQAAPNGMAFNYRTDTLITFFDDSSAATLTPAKTPGRLVAGMGAWTLGTRRFLSAGGYVTFPSRNCVAAFTTTGQDLFITDGNTVDSVAGGATLVAPENNSPGNVCFVSKGYGVNDSLVTVAWELNDSLMVRLGCFTGAAYPYGWSWLTAAKRVDARLSPTGDATTGIRKEGRVSFLGNVLYVIYKDWRNTANIDSVDICERHIDLASIPANLDALSSETILRHAIDGSLIVSMQTPQRYDATRNIIWEAWRDDAAAGSRTVYAHIDTASVTPPAGASSNLIARGAVIRGTVVR